MKKQNKLAIVGIGNELCKDDGFGILAVRKLKDKNFNSGTLIEGGTSGLSLIPLFFEYDNLIFLDILKINDKPGSIYIIPIKELGYRKINPISFHDIGLEDAYINAKMLGAKANVYLVGIVPKDYIGLGGISDILESKIEVFLDQVIKLSQRITGLNN